MPGNITLVRANMPFYNLHSSTLRNPFLKRESKLVWDGEWRPPCPNIRLILRTSIQHVHRWMNYPTTTNETIFVPWGVLRQSEAFKQRGLFSPRRRSYHRILGNICHCVSVSGRWEVQDGPVRAAIFMTSLVVHYGDATKLLVTGLWFSLGLWWGRYHKRWIHSLSCLWVLKNAYFIPSPSARRKLWFRIFDSFTTVARIPKPYWRRIHFTGEWITQPSHVSTTYEYLHFSWLSENLMDIFVSHQSTGMEKLIKELEDSN